MFSEPATPEPDARGRTVSDALDQADRKRGGAKAGGDEKRQDGEHHLEVRIRRQIRDTDSEVVAVQPPHRHRNGGRSWQMISSGSESNGPHSFSATNVFPANGFPLCNTP